MDPNNQKPQGDNGAVNKLEQDLQNIKDQTTATQTQSVPEVTPVAQIPQVTEVPPAVPVTPAPPMVPAENSTFVPEGPKKSSPLLIIAIVLALVAVLAVVAYVFGAKLFSPTPKQVACTQEAKICPDGTSVGQTGPNCEFAPCPTAIATPIETLIKTASPSATPTVTPSAKPTSTPSSSPTTTP